MTSQCGDLNFVVNVLFYIFVCWLLQHKRLQEEQRDREKERQLQKRVTELTNQISRLEKRVALLKQENDGLVRILHKNIHAKNIIISNRI